MKSTVMAKKSKPKEVRVKTDLSFDEVLFLALRTKPLKNKDIDKKHKTKKKA